MLLMVFMHDVKHGHYNHQGSYKTGMLGSYFSISNQLFTQVHESFNKIKISQQLNGCFVGGSKKYSSLKIQLNIKKKKKKNVHF